MAYDDVLSTEQAFQRYEEVRPRFPNADFPARSQACTGLLQIADQFDAFLLDSFGVLNVGDLPIPGAPDCIAALRAMGKRVIVLTNAASYTRDTAIAKYHRLGFDFTAGEVVSSRDVAVRRLAPGHWGAIAAADDGFKDIPGQITHWDGGAVDGLLMLSSADLTPARFDRIENTLRREPCPVVVANPDLVAPRETGLSKEPGFFAHLLADRLGVEPAFFGKPFGDAFEDALARLPGIPRDRIAMVGDTLHTDILGGRAAGTRTVLVTDHGLFAGKDVHRFVARSGIVPDFYCPGI